MILQDNNVESKEIKNIYEHNYINQIWKGKINLNDGEFHNHSLFICYLCLEHLILCDDNCETNQVQTCKNYVQKAIIESIQIFYSTSFPRSCKCTQNRISCETEDIWLQKQLGIVFFNYSKNDIQPRKLHPAVFPIDLPKYFISLLTHENDVILDPFGGTGTTALAALLLNRIPILIDLSQNYSDFALERIKKHKFTNKFLILNGNTHDISKLLHNESINLILTSPPYANLLNKEITHRSRINRNRDITPRQYSQDEADLGILDLDTYLSNVHALFTTLYEKLKNNGHVIINVCNDIYDKSTGKTYQFPSKIITIMEEIGFIYKNKIIWDRTKFYSNAHIFGYPSNFMIFSGSYEYILHFTK